MTFGIVPIVNPTKTLMGIFVLQQGADPLPIDSIFNTSDIPFVGQRPPHIAIRGESGDQVSHIACVVLFAHAAISPLVVGMKEDDIGLDAYVEELANAFVEVLKKGIIGPGEILYIFKRILPGFGRVSIAIGLGKHTHANLVEGGFGQGLDGLCLDALLDAGPLIGGRPH